MRRPTAAGPAGLRGWAGLRPYCGSGFFCHLFCFGADEGIIQRRQRIEFCRVAVELLRFCVVTLALIGLAQAIKVARVLQVRLFEFGDCLVVVFLCEGNSSGQFMRQLYLGRVL